MRMWQAEEKEKRIKKDKKKDAKPEEKNKNEAKKADKPEQTEKASAGDDGGAKKITRLVILSYLFLEFVHYHCFPDYRPICSMLTNSWVSIS